MEQRIYHGNLSPSDISETLISHFNRGNLRAQQLGDSDRLIVQIGTRPGAMAGGDTTVSVILQKVEDGVAVQLGQQAWLGIAASLGTTALAAMRNPFNLLGRLDDLAQDIQNLQINEQVWQAIDEVSHGQLVLHKSFPTVCGVRCAHTAKRPIRWVSQTVWPVEHHSVMFSLEPAPTVAS